MRIGLILLMLVFILPGCSKSSNGDDTPPPPPPPPSPSAATLVFPDNNTECNEGEILSENQSRVTFEWNAAQNTDSYEVNLRNLDTNGTTMVNVSTTSAPIIIDRGAPYEWFVVSKASGTMATANSATWKFYNQGAGITNYAPFPAAAVYPSRGSSINASGGTLTLEWTTSDVDGDLLEFDVYFDTDPEPDTLLGTTSDTTLDTSISSGTIYYWRVLSRDSAGNSSESEIFQFRVN